LLACLMMMIVQERRKERTKENHSFTHSFLDKESNQIKSDKKSEFTKKQKTSSLPCLNNQNKTRNKLLLHLTQLKHLAATSRNLVQNEFNSNKWNVNKLVLLQRKAIHRFFVDTSQAAARRNAEIVIHNSLPMVLRIHFPPDK